MSVAFEDIHVDRVKAALTDPAALAAFESLMEQLDQARNVALVMGTALFEMRGELAAAHMCQNCGGAGTVEDGHGDFETCPDCGLDWRASAARAEAALLRVSEQQPKTLAMIKANGFVFDSIGREPGNWQHLAFSVYTDLCEVDTIARAALSAGSGGRETTA